MHPAETIKDKVTALIAAVNSNPAAARATLRVSTRLEAGLQCRASARNLPPIIVDEPRRAGGTDQGMSPVELLLCALGTCQEVMYAIHASLMNIELDELRVDCRGKLDLRGMLGTHADAPVELTEIEFETHIRSSADEVSIVQLIERAESHCPIMASMTRPVRTSGKAYLNGSQVAVAIATNHA